MKYLLILVLFVGSCDTPNSKVIVKTEQVIIYDTVPTQQDRYRAKYKLPEAYNIYQDSAGKYYGTYTFSDCGLIGYLRMDPFNCRVNVLGMLWLEKDATKCDRPYQVVTLIKRNWADILADRAKYK